MELYGATKQYRIRAYFTEVMSPRSYRWKETITDIEEAKRILEEAKRYYAKYSYLDKVVIEERYVTSWEESDYE